MGPTIANGTMTSPLEGGVIDEAALRQRYADTGQDHVFAHWTGLSSPQQAHLLHQLTGIAVEDLASLLASAQSSESEEHGSIQPFAGTVARTQDDETLVSASRQAGMEAIRKGQVAALVLAGGQGTRLGFSGPKGMYDIGLPSGQSLFALMAARLLKLSRLASSPDDGICNPIPVYIMTSPMNHDETVSYFASNQYFDLGEENVFFFRQGMLPCLTTKGKIILEAADVVAMAPDGNGGLYPALVASNALNDMVHRGVQFLHVFSIDNALVKPADPVFVGYCLSQNADCGNKVVWKVSAHEAVGVVASRNDKPCIVEYSEITKEMAELTDITTGRLVYGAANICNHFYTIDFIQNVILPNMGKFYHVAHKKIPYFDEATASTLSPDANNGIKLETFIFDVFPFSKRMAIVDVDRLDEFAPVKNKPGSPVDSPDSAREMISKQAKSWTAAAGASLSGDLAAICEILPSTSYCGEGLESSVKGKDVVCPFLL